MAAKKYPKYIKDMAMRIDETVKNGTFFTKTEADKRRNGAAIQICNYGNLRY